MNQAMRWKRFVEWWDMEDFKDLSRDEVIDLVDEKIDALKEGR